MIYFLATVFGQNLCFMHMTIGRLLEQQSYKQCQSHFYLMEAFSNILRT